MVEMDLGDMTFLFLMLFFGLFLCLLACLYGCKGFTWIFNNCCCCYFFCLALFEDQETRLRRIQDEEDRKEQQKHKLRQEAVERQKVREKKKKEQRDAENEEENNGGDGSGSGSKEKNAKLAALMGLKDKAKGGGGSDDPEDEELARYLEKKRKAKLEAQIRKMEDDLCPPPGQHLSREERRIARRRDDPYALKVRVNKDFKLKPRKDNRVHLAPLEYPPSNFKTIDYRVHPYRPQDTKKKARQQMPRNDEVLPRDIP